MTAIQERLQVNRVPLDKWSVREQLCLASAVSCSGDQNWMTVSRTLKIVCGNAKNTLYSRPADWFSQKNCAVQYGHLLEEFETPKRKNRSSDSCVSPATVDAPTDAILRRLTEERLQEIKIELRKEQEEYAKLYKEIKSLQSGEIADDQLLQIWNDLEKDQEMQRIEEMKFENQLRERELKKQEIQRSWRTGTNIHSSSLSSNSLKSSTDTTTVDMDVEEIIGTGTPATNIATSPSIRSTAPTITTLLTGGSIPNQNQPALIPSHDKAVHLLARPISGPPLDTISSSASVTQTLLSPSQSAPTLSMLLEKTKTFVQNVAERKTTEIISTNPKVIENEIIDDSNKESVPMDIEEDISGTKADSNPDIQSDDIDETDPNEEQQLLEVFKNIGNIEELDIDVSDVIDEEVDFLKGVDEETPLDENIDIEQKLSVNLTDLAENIKLLSNEATSANPSSADLEKPLSNQGTENANDIESGDNKIEIISSDDSNDNIPLAAVASLESSNNRLTMNESSNEDNFLKDQVESATLKNEIDQIEITNESFDNSATIKQEMLDENIKLKQVSSEVDDKQIEKSVNNDLKDDVFVAPLTEDTKLENNLKVEKEQIDVVKQEEIKVEVKEENDMNDPNSFVETENIDSNKAIPNLAQDAIDTLAISKIQPPPSVSIANSDENSSSTDISVQARKDDKNICRGIRKSQQEIKTDDETPNPTIQQIATPNVTPASGNLTTRPTALRKLRDRDRSESPMIDDDTTTHSDHSTTNQRSRRRYSSTPVIDSVPNSPASSDRDERDLRTSKKSLLSIYNVLFTSKYSSTIQRVLNDESSAQRLDEICLRSIDFQTIKKSIENGLIRSVYELQRDILWMCQNALVITKISSASFKTILQFQQECQNIREFMCNGCEPDHKLERETRDNKSNSSTSSSTGGSTTKGRSGSRKSLRLS